MYKILLSILIIGTLFSCKKQSAYVDIHDVFVWKYSTIDNRIINPDSLGLVYSVHFEGNNVAFFEDNIKLFEGAVISVDNAFSAHDHGADISSRTTYQILVNNSSFDVKKRTFNFNVYYSRYGYQGTTTYSYSSNNFPFEQVGYSTQSDYPSFGGNNQFEKQP